MNGNHPHEALDGGQDTVELGLTAPTRVLHRLAAARQARGLSCFEIARRLGTTVEKVRLQEEAADLSISTLNAWAAALNVPVTDLVVEPDEWLQETNLAKPQAERLLRLAVELRDRSRRRSVQRLAQTFVDQLSEINPALNSGGNGNGNGHRHRQTLIGLANGRRTNGKHTNGVTTNGKHANGELTNGVHANGEPTDGEPTNGNHFGAPAS
jgi:transcriptional regulator with XRE-family HTH domain